METIYRNLLDIHGRKWIIIIDPLLGMVCKPNFERENMAGFCVKNVEEAIEYLNTEQNNYDMTHEEWCEKYDPHYEEDTEILGNTDARYVWTEIAVDDDNAITNGFWGVNAVGYYISEIPWETDVMVDPRSECDKQ